MSREKNGQQKANRSVLLIVYLTVILFLCMIAYFLYFVVAKAPDITGNTYNPRDKLLAERFVRGEIISADGTVLAKTERDKEGNESRVYPDGALFSHVTGYMQRGKTGVESLANFYLLTSHLNSLELAENDLLGDKTLGDNVILTLDKSLQQTAADALGKRSGAVIAMDPSTGRILCSYSSPGYDPNTIVEDWDSLNAEGNGTGRLLNRASQGLYPPGSTFKILTLLEYIHEHPDDWQTAFTYDCDGSYEDAEGNVIRCYGGEKHGHETLEQAFINSCNGAFAKIGSEIDQDRLHALAEKLLFNSPLPFQLPYNQSRFSASSQDGLFLKELTAIGQGNTMMTPLHGLMLVSAIANGGDLMRPMILSELENAAGDTVRTFPERRYDTLFTADEVAVLKTWMQEVVTNGTASKLKTDKYQAAAKTGSAEYDNGNKTHAWCLAFAPADDPKIAVAVVVEDGKSGGQTAAPIVKAVLDNWLLR